MNVKEYAMRYLAGLMGVVMLSGCATEMIGQCAMKSVSGDPVYAASCGAAMAMTAAAAVAGGVVLIKETVQQKTQSEPSAPVAEVNAQ